MAEERLTSEEINSELTDSQWRFAENSLRKTFELSSFDKAISFVTSVAAAAETAQHHPDIDIRYNKVTLTLQSHDVGGVTTRDIGLAKTINGLAQ